MLKNKMLSAMGGAPANYIEDVFSTWLYTGNGSTQTITNGIDLAGEGGLVWLKARSTTGESALFDTDRGTGTLLTTSSTREARSETGFGAYLSDGFSFAGAGSTVAINFDGRTFASWTFRKQPKFFDVVTWSGDASGNRTLSHTLASTPGCIIIKATNAVDDWYVYHTSLGTGKWLYLNTTGAEQTGSIVTAVSSTTFTVSQSNGFNTNGNTYVAYLFAHDAGGFGLSGTDNVISCGSFTDSATVNLGYEPQWIMVKRTNTTGDWVMVDTMRGLTANFSGSAAGDAQLLANTSGAELAPPNGDIGINSTGFRWNGSAGTYIYIAIRRGPMKVPTDGTSVFTPYQVPASPTTGAITGFVTDAGFIGQRAGADKFYWGARLMGNPTINSTSTAAESANTNQIWDRMNGWWNSAINGYMTWGFRRAPGFMDTVCYTGTGVARTVEHNLTVAPEMMIVKARGGTTNWAVYHAGTGSNNFLLLNTTAATVSAASYWNNTTPTSSVFSVGGASATSEAGLTYVAYLFATAAGVSKVGSYTGTGTTQQINCGFTGGARFIMIKRTDSTGDWYVWDTVRGIVAGNDPYLLLNSTAAEVTSTDYIDPVSSGFEISSTAPAAINASGGTFIFLAIA